MGLFLSRNNVISVFGYKQEAGVNLWFIWFNIKWLGGGRLNFYGSFVRGIKIKIKHACIHWGFGLVVWFILTVKKT